MWKKNFKNLIKNNILQKNHQKTDLGTQLFLGFGFGFGSIDPDPNPKPNKIQDPNPNPNPKSNKIQDPNPNPNPKPKLFGF